MKNKLASNSSHKQRKEKVSDYLSSEGGKVIHDGQSASMQSSIIGEVKVFKMLRNRVQGMEQSVVSSSRDPVYLIEPSE